MEGGGVKREEGYRGVCSIAIRFLFRNGQNYLDKVGSPGTVFILLTACNKSKLTLV